jgi:hypothetical protein
MALTADVKKVEQALIDRAGSKPDRAKALSTAYIDAATERAVKVTTARELPPTTIRSTHISLLVELLDRFEDVPTANELSALLRVTQSGARALLNDVLATSDVAATRLLGSAFKRATRSETPAGPGAEVKNGYEWRFSSRNELVLARQRLELAGVEYRTRNSTDGSYVLLVDPAFDPR